MRTLATVILLSMILVLGCKQKTPGTSQNESSPEAAEVAETLIYYTCPMEAHKHIHSSEPGKCPECSMDLVKAVVTSVEKSEYYGCPMEIHSHIRQAEPGKCSECSMELKPMRLVKTDS